MKKVQVNLQGNFAYGTLFWVSASNKKVYHSSRRLDSVEFTEHESNYIGELEALTSKTNQTILLRKLKNTDRVYGISIDNEDGLKKSETREKATIMFFDNLEKLMEYAEPRFEAYDSMKEKKEIEMK